MPVREPTIEQTVNDIASETINDIAAETGSAPGHIDSDALRAQLLWCNRLWGLHEGARDHAPSRDKAIRARAAVSTLLALLRDDEVLRREAEAAGLLPPLETSPLKAFYNQIDPKKLNVGAKEVMTNTKELLGMWGRPLDTLVEWLQQVYEDIFKQPAKSWRLTDGSPADTPFVRFVHRVTTAFGIKCSRLTIHLAYERIRRRQRQHTTK